MSGACLKAFDFRVVPNGSMVKEEWELQCVPNL